MNTAPEKRAPRVLAQAGLLTYQFDITWRAKNTSQVKKTYPLQVQCLLISLTAARQPRQIAAVPVRSQASIG